MQHGSGQAKVSGSLPECTIASNAMLRRQSNLRSRLPKAIQVDRQTSATRQTEKEKSSTSPQTLRRHRRERAKESIPLREVFSSQDASSQAGKIFGRIPGKRKHASGAEDVRYSSLKVPGLGQPTKYQAERDVEKGIAELDGRPGGARGNKEESPDRMTFAEWKLSNFLPGGKFAYGVALSPGINQADAAETSHISQSFVEAGPQHKPSESTARTESSLNWEDIPFSEPYGPASTVSTGEKCPYPEIPIPRDPSRRLSKTSLHIHRFLAALFIVLCNTAPLIAYFQSHRHLWVLIFIVFVKAKDVLSTLIAAVALSYQRLKRRREKVVIPTKSIISLITVSFETEEQIMKTLESIRDADLGHYRQFLCMILDGPPKHNIHRKIVRTRKGIHRPYITWLFRQNDVDIDCGFLEGIPTIYIQKLHNQGKKDSLILCHDLFNYLRPDAPLYTKLLREEIWSSMIPTLVASPPLTRFDAIFCTDADSIIHKDAQRRLLEELHKEKNSIAACGILLAELDYRTEWSIWSLFQQFQYSYGQVVRRQAEGIWGRVTCLPGCITMIVVRPEMANAIQDYAKPVRDITFWRHQVQYLGTDRRLTYSMLSQGKGLKTLFVPDAVSETVCPQSLKHYLNQRRRWGSNAYFNDYFYCFGSRQYLITRLWAFIDISRMSFVYYRQANNILFLYGLATNFNIIKIVPLLIVTQTPTIWFLILVLTRQPILRRRIHKLILGLLLNYVLSPILSILVFSRMILQLGSAGATWDNTGICTAKPDPTLQITTPRNSWSSSRLSSIIRATFLDECLAPQADDEAYPVKAIPDIPDAATSRAPSIAETTRSARTAFTVSSGRIERLPSRVRSLSLERHQRAQRASRGWPLDENAPPLPKDIGEARRRVSYARSENSVASMV